MNFGVLLLNLKLHFAHILQNLLSVQDGINPGYLVSHEQSRRL